MSTSNQKITKEMLESIAKTFCVAHQGDDDARLAQALVYNAGRLAWRMREAGISTKQKTSVSDVVTEADEAAEFLVSHVLETLRPDDGILGEEGSSHASASGKTWVIDPVDGTYNFASGSDYWCSALALCTGAPSQPDEVILGAVHRPAMGYTWFGGPQFPTTRDGKKVAGITDAEAGQICLASYIHPTWVANDELMGHWRRVTELFATVRMLGAGSVDLASVADGTLGCWMQYSVKDWDWLPGKALVEAAGGVTAEVPAGGVVWKIAGAPTAVEQMKEALNR